MASYELPMAAVGCGLDDHALAEQLQRYRELGIAAIDIERRELGLTARFDATVNVTLLDETIAVERSCCSFFALDYDASERSLTISVEDRERINVLELIGSALSSALAPPDTR